MPLKLLLDSVYPSVRFSGGVSIGKKSWERRFFPVNMRWPPPQKPTQSDKHYGAGVSGGPKLHRSGG